MESIIILVLVMISVAFFTLIERKVLGYIHIRKGPNKPGPIGLMVPFADAVKLFLKEIRYPMMSNRAPFIIVGVIIMIVPMTIWVSFPILANMAYHKLALIIIMAAARVGVYGTLGAGWRRNRKYSLLGAVRAVAQTISYEVRMSIILLSSMIFIMYDVSQKKIVRVGIWLTIILLLFSVSVLAESNRSPFDFAEGERELVRGFNTEYSSVIFVIIFLAEYIAIIFISILTSILFLITNFTEIIMFTGFIGFFYIWARGTLPRFRYDQLIYLAWKSFLPFSLIFLLIVILIFSKVRALKACRNKAKIIYISLYMVTSIIITLLLIFLIILTYKTLVDKEKSSPFECGFDPNNISRLPFCMKFFMVVVIFLVFDIEVALILPMLFSSLSVFSFILVLTVGAMYEWAYGGLNWLV